MVPRPELVAEVEAALDHCRLVQVAAPLGFGKTVLLAQWAAATRHRVAWLSARGCEDELALADEVREVIATFRGASPADGDLVVVVDDICTTAPVPSLARILTGADDCDVRLVAATRSRPAPDVTAAALRGEARVLTDYELTFTDDEVHQAFSAAAGRAVDDLGISRLRRRCAGWPAAVGAVARALRAGLGSADALGSVTEMLLDYLEAELFDELPPAWRQLLSDTVAVPCLSGPLGAEALGVHDLGAVLRVLRDQGFPLVPHSRRNLEYAVLPLLRTAIEARLVESAPGRRQEVARAAAEWFEHRGDAMSAVQVHASIGAWDAFTDVVRTSLYELMGSDRMPELAVLLAEVPAAVRRRSAGWLLGFAYLQLVSGYSGEALEALAVNESWLDEDDRAQADCIRAGAVYWRADPLPAVVAARAALDAFDRLGEDHRFENLYAPMSMANLRSQAVGSLLGACALAGEWGRVRHEAQPTPTLVLAEMPAVAAQVVVGGRALYLALAGRAREAAAEADHALSYALGGMGFADRAQALALLARAESHRLQGRWEEAVVDADAAATRAWENQRRTIGSVALLVKALSLVDGHQLGPASEVLADPRAEFCRGATARGMAAAAHIRLAVAAGRFDVARGVLADAPRTPAVGSAVAVLALSTNDLALLRSMVEAWPDDGIPQNVVRRSLAEAALLLGQNRGEAQERFDRALSLALRHGLAQPFRMAGRFLTPLVRRASLDASPRAAELLGSAREAAASDLTGRETVVMNLLAEGLTLQAIAERIHVSVNTVKTHVRSAYRKLGASRRVEAVRAWQALTDPGS